MARVHPLVKLSGALAGIFLSLSIYSTPLASNNRGEAPDTPGTPVFAAPMDPRFLFDQVDLELHLPGVEKAIQLSTRPSQFIFLTVPSNEQTRTFKKEQTRTFKKYGLRLIPEIDGKPVVDYQTLESADDSQLSFEVILTCIETAKTEADRLAFGQRGDADACADQVDFSNLHEGPRDLKVAENGVALWPRNGVKPGQKVVDKQYTGSTLLIKKYRRLGPPREPATSPFAKTCADVQGMTVCACKVIHAGKESSRGCI